MKIAEIQFPEDLITALRDGTLVVFAGAGVSMGSPANLPDFKRLTELIAAETGERIRDTELEDRFLGRLHLNGVEVHTRAAEILSRAIPTPTELHRNLLRLYGEPRKVRIVTTNFDLLFETAAPEILKVPPDQFLALALPLGHNFSGIVHVHGALSRPRDMVLTDANFGRGYLTEGWARRFLVDLFRHFTVLFVGYRHNDTIVNYLTRALPESEAGKRFVLTGAGDDPHKWRVLGIVPIGYPKSRDGDYSGLYEGVRRLADTVNRTILDWQRDIIELAKKLPPVGEEEEDIIEHALKEAATTRFFTSAARSPEWISWIDKRKHLDPLFGDTEVQEQHALLASWLAENYVPRHSEELFLLLSRHGTHLSPLLWWTLERSVFLGPTAVTDPDLLSRWVSLLLTAIPENLNQQVLQHGLRSMGHRCREAGLTAGLLHIFNFMTSSRLVLKKPFVSSLGREGSPKRQVEVAPVLVGDDYWLNELWNTALKPNLEHFGADLLKIIICRLEERHSIWVAWQKAKRDFDLDSWRRSAIESGEQDVRRVEMDVLVDAARDCLDHMISDPATMPYINLQCDQLSRAEAPLLRRLAVHMLPARSDLTDDGKLDWLVRYGLHDIATVPEILRAERLIYPRADREARSRLIQAVLAYRWPDQADPEKERRTARYHYDRLQWLNTSAPDCPLAKAALEEVLEQFPEFRPKEHPDLAVWAASGWVGPQSPWTIEQLLSKPATEWLDELLSFRPKDVLGADRDGLVSFVAQASKQNIEWGLGLAESLRSANKWEADLWVGLLRAWSEATLREEHAQKMMEYLATSELQSTHSREIADILFQWMKRDDFPIGLLPGANAIAESLWQDVGTAESAGETDDWLQVAINSEPGVLAEFWLYSLSKWRKQQDPAPTALAGEYRTALSNIVSGRGSPARLARCVLCSQLAFLLVADDDWTKANLVPLFDPENATKDFQPAWDGFLIWGHLTPTVAKLLESASLKTVQHIGKIRDRRERFVEHYVSMLIYFAPDPLKLWIPEFFRYADMAARRHFAWAIGSNLRGMNEEQQDRLWRSWLGRYWENRLQGIPSPLEDGEVEPMLDWLPHLKAVFLEAVQLAIRMPPVRLQHPSLLYDLPKSGIEASYPEPVAKLLIYLGGCRSESDSLLWGDARELISKLVAAALPDPLKTKLKELAAKLGFSP